MEYAYFLSDAMYTFSYSEDICCSQKYEQAITVVILSTYKKEHQELPQAFKRCMVPKNSFDICKLYTVTCEWKHVGGLICLRMFRLPTTHCTGFDETYRVHGTINLYRSCEALVHITFLISLENFPSLCAFEPIKFQF